MDRLSFIGLLLVSTAGCISARPWNEPIAPPVAVLFDNPMFIPVQDPHQVWENVVDVVDDHFRIRSEEPVRAGILTEGRLDTFPEVGSTILEPWRSDSADTYEKLESTLQSIRRYAQVRVIPAQGGHLLDVTVFKELEDVTRPAHSSAGAATFRNDTSLTRVVNPIYEQEIHENWIALGRDRALEQRLLGELQSRFGVVNRTPLPTTTAPSGLQLPPPPGAQVVAPGSLGVLPQAAPQIGPCAPPVLPCAPPVVQTPSTY